MTAVIVGGGPSGTALATWLAQAGREITLVERHEGPTDKVCGEFLSGEAAVYLATLGIDLSALGAVAIDSLRLCEGGRTSEVKLPFPALSLSRRVLDEALLALAEAAGANIRRGIRVDELKRSGRGWRARLADGSAIEARTAFLATGKHDLRGHRRPRGSQNDLVAFKLHWRLVREQAAELAGYVELVLFKGGYAGLQPLDESRANLCLLIRRRRLQDLGGRWPGLLAALRAASPHLDRRLTGATSCWARPVALAAIPYGHVQRNGDGPWRLGDQAAVIPSFSGEGISIALHSAAVAAATYLQGGDAGTYQRHLARDVAAQVVIATTLSHGLVRRPAQAALGVAARLWPGLMSSVASQTRVPHRALHRASV